MPEQLSIDTFSLVTLCAALVLVTAWGLVGWEQRYAWKKKAALHKGQAEEWEQSRDRWKVFGEALSADMADHRANANLWREAALDTEKRKRQQYKLPEWPTILPAPYGIRKDEMHVWRDGKCEVLHL